MISDLDNTEITSTQTPKGISFLFVIALFISLFVHLLFLLLHIKPASISVIQIDKKPVQILLTRASDTTATKIIEPKNNDIKRDTEISNEVVETNNITENLPNNTIQHHESPTEDIHAAISEMPSHTDIIRTTNTYSERYGNLTPADNNGFRNNSQSGNSTVFDPRLRAKLNATPGTINPQLPDTEAISLHGETYIRAAEDICFKAINQSGSGRTRDWYSIRCRNNADTGDTMLRNIQQQMNAKYRQPADSLP